VPGAVYINCGDGARRDARERAAPTRWHGTSQRATRCCGRCSPSRSVSRR